MRVVFVIWILFITAYAENLEITKYVTNEKPKILVQTKNLPIPLKKLLKIDTSLISHYDIDIDKNTTYDSYNYLLRLDYTKNKLKANLYNLVKKEPVLYKEYKIPKFSVYPFMIHYLSYDINSKLGFLPVDWIKKKIVYSIYISPKENNIFIADVTLRYRKKIISGGLNIFPKWADDAQTEIYYTKLQRDPVLYKYNIYTAQKSRVLSSKGMLVVSDVMGDELLLTLALDEQPDIYKYNINTRKLTRITKYPGIDVNGQFYGDSVVFISDRLGYPNVYEKHLKTGIISRFIYQGKNHISVTTNKDNVVISSRETNRAFADNTFNLLLVNRDTNILKRLTFGGKNMMPVFSKRGDTILFIKEYKFNSKLGIIRLNENKIFYFKLNRRMQSFDF